MESTTTTKNKYHALYRYLVVLDEQQIHKLHKVVSGMLDVNAFSAAEIEQLQRRLAGAGQPAPVMQMVQN